MSTSFNSGPDASKLLVNVPNNSVMTGKVPGVEVSRILWGGPQFVRTQGPGSGPQSRVVQTSAESVDFRVFLWVRYECGYQEFVVKLFSSQIGFLFMDSGPFNKVRFLLVLSDSYLCFGFLSLPSFPRFCPCLTDHGVFLTTINFMEGPGTRFVFFFLGGSSLLCFFISLTTQHHLSRKDPLVSEQKNRVRRDENLRFWNPHSSGAEPEFKWMNCPIFEPLDSWPVLLFQSQSTYLCLRRKKQRI